MDNRASKKVREVKTSLDLVLAELHKYEKMYFAIWTIEHWDAERIKGKLDLLKTYREHLVNEIGALHVSEASERAHAYQFWRQTRKNRK